MASTIEDSTQAIKNHLTSRRRRVLLPSLGLRVSERRLLLFIIDIFLLNLALVFSLLLRTELLPDFSALLWNAKWFVTLVAIWAIVATILDVYDLARAASTTYSLGSSVTAALLASITYLFIPWLTPPIENRSQGFIFVGLSIGFIAAWRLLYSNLFVQPVFYRRALIIGSGASARSFIQAITGENNGGNGNPFQGTGHQIIGFVDDNPQSEDDKAYGIPVLGGSDDLLSLVISQDVDELVVTFTQQQEMKPALFKALMDCREVGVPVVAMPTIYERLTGRVAYEYASWNVEIATGQSDSPFLRLYEFLKRGVDILGALFGIAVVVLLMPMAALGNVLTSPGPLFFHQLRVGRRGKPINVIKFRSMVPSAEADSGAVWASIDDQRVTPVGRLFRLTHLDELPQVINVIRGEMSLVGPRPERPEFVENLSVVIPFYRARHSIRPGITGWAQIHQDYGDSVDRAKEKLEYDLYYLKHAGPILDTIIILRTIAKVLGFRGR